MIALRLTLRRQHRVIFCAVLVQIVGYAYGIGKAEKPNTVGLPPSYGSFQPTLKTFTPRPAAAGASMNLIWHLGQQPEAGYSAKRVRASASVALHVKKR